MASGKKQGLQGRKIQQIKMLPQTHAAIKQSAYNSSIEISEMYDKIISQYLDLIDQRPNPVEYFASPKRGVNTSMWINTEICERAAQRAKLDGTSTNRVIYTAIRHFTNQLTGF